jgi:hypothetical protein
METQGRLRQAPNTKDLWSKLTDGVLTAVILILLWTTISLTVRPLVAAFGAPGLLVFVLGLLAVSMGALQQSIVARQPEPTRAWFGIAAGFLAWWVVELTGHMGVPVFPNLASVILLVMVGLITAVLWRSVLPIGVRFFSLTLLLNWSEHIFTTVQDQLVVVSPVFALAQRVIGVSAALGVLLMLGWILFRSRRRLQRVSGALAIWFLISLVIYGFRGAF